MTLVKRQVAELLVSGITQTEPTRQGFVLANTCRDQPDRKGGAFRGPAGRHCCALGFLRPNRGLAAAPFNALPATKRATSIDMARFPGVAVWYTEYVAFNSRSGTPFHIARPIQRPSDWAFPPMHTPPHKLRCLRYLL